MFGSAIKGRGGIEDFGDQGNEEQEQDGHGISISVGTLDYP